MRVVQQGPGPRPFDVSGSFLIELDPTGWLDWLGLPVEGEVQSIESDVGTVLAEVDKVLRVEAPSPWLAHIELQASHDPDLPLRLLQYHALLLRRHKIRVETVVVLLRPSADDTELTGRFEQPGVIHDVTMSLGYSVVRLWEIPAEELLNGGIGVVGLAPLGMVEPAEVPNVMRRMEERASREVPPSRYDELRTATRFLLGLRYDAEQILGWMQGMSWVRESSLWQIAVDEGVEKGREEGREEGRIEEARRLVLELGAERLGSPDQAVLNAISRIDDHDTLKRLLRDSFTAVSWQELLAFE
jgi:predicted transposase YdaD